MRCFPLPSPIIIRGKIYTFLTYVEHIVNTDSRYQKPITHIRHGLETLNAIRSADFEYKYQLQHLLGGYIGSHIRESEVEIWLGIISVLGTERAEDLLNRLKPLPEALIKDVSSDNDFSNIVKLSDDTWEFLCVTLEQPEYGYCAIKLGSGEQDPIGNYHFLPFVDAVKTADRIPDYAPMGHANN